VAVENNGEKKVSRHTEEFTIYIKRAKYYITEKVNNMYLEL